MNENEAILINLVRDLATEIHPGFPESRSITLDYSLTDDIGLDSLSRIELLARVENRFGITIPERAFADIETLRDLLRAIQTAKPALVVPPTSAVKPAITVDTWQTPHDAKTLIDVLNWHAKTHPDKVHIFFYSDEEEEETLTYQQLRKGAETVAFNLRHRGVTPMEPVALMLATDRQFFFAFFGIMLAGGIPVPLYPPARRS
ncbi:MAG: AMP-binding protein, partial [Syntrophaceae bacterium]|nr:AMP-binding protein [Syntrophaceae bacterium]